MVDSRQHWTNKERPKSSLIQTAGDQIGEGLGCDLSFLAETVHVDFVAEEIGDGAHVCREASEPQIARGCVVEDLGEVV